MLSCLMYEKIMEVKISGNNDEFKKDLARLVNTIDKADRRYDPVLRVWIVKNPEKYVSIPEIRAAIEDRKRQPLLF